MAKFINDIGDDRTADRVYCLYVQSHRGKLFDAWWKWIENRAKANALSDCALAYALDMAVREGKPELAKRFAEVLSARAKLEDGTAHWTTAGFSRWGDDRFEVTAAALKALVAYDSNDPLVEKALAFFAATKRGNRWNSTKDTAMILFAMCDYLAKSKVGEPKPGDLEIAVNGRTRTMKLDGAFAQTLVIPASELKAGPTELAMKTVMKGAMVRAVFRHWKSGRDIAPTSHGLGVERKFSLVDVKGTVLRELKSGDAVPRGSFIWSEVVTRNQNVEDSPYLLVENPKPGGCEVIAKDDKRFEKLVEGDHSQREDRDAKVSYLHEHAGIFSQNRCVFLAELAGEYVVAPASAELMYRPQTRGHSGSFVLKVLE